MLTAFQQHFYTNKSTEEFSESLRARRVQIDERSIYDLRLGIAYRVDFVTRCWYWLVSGVAAAALVFFVRIFDPAALRPEQLPAVSLIPVLSGVLGALAALRPQESIVIELTRVYKLWVLGVVSLLTAYFLLGLVSPGAITWIRAELGAVPGVGRVVHPS